MATDNQQTSENENNDGIAKLAELIEGIQFAMLTTIDEEGMLRSRPMTTQQTTFDGDLWFFTCGTSPKAYEIATERRVNVSFAAPEDHRYVSISGIARIVRDRAKMEELWNPAYKAWFPKGLDDPDIALLKIDAEKAEYWDSPSSTMVQIFGFVKALATGQQYDAGENEKLDLNTGTEKG